jgi:hypothetical protein
VEDAGSGWARKGSSSEALDWIGTRPQPAHPRIGEIPAAGYTRAVVFSIVRAARLSSSPSLGSCVAVEKNSGLA